MTELDREAILGDRADQLAKYAERRELHQMVKRKEQAEGGARGGAESSDEDEQLRATTRERKATGTTREKRETLEKLKKSREEKGKKKEKKVRLQASSMESRVREELTFRLA